MLWYRFAPGNPERHADRWCRADWTPMHNDHPCSHFEFPNEELGYYLGRYPDYNFIVGPEYDEIFRMHQEVT